MGWCSHPQTCNSCLGLSSLHYGRKNICSYFPSRFSELLLESPSSQRNCIEEEAEVFCRCTQKLTSGRKEERPFSIRGDLGYQCGSKLVAEQDFLDPAQMECVAYFCGGHWEDETPFFVILPTHPAGTTSPLFAPLKLQSTVDFLLG